MGEKTRLRAWTVGLAMVTAGLVAAACGDGEMIGGGGDDEDGSTFTFGRGSDSVTLDPVNASDGESLLVARQVFDGLLGFAPESTDLVPALAAEIPEPEEDGSSTTSSFARASSSTTARP